MGLKRAQFDPGGSVKDRTAYTLVAGLEDWGVLGPVRPVGASASGSLGAALAPVRRSGDCPVVAEPRGVRPGAVFVGASMGSTLIGVARYSRGPTATGACRPCDFARPRDHDQVRHVPTADAAGLVLDAAEPS
ncbi:hypothetical protein [Streptomyces sp. NPDC087300]|uniref:hypothetical protein n=1 Tax=Streptomyces sp. NPDC087300 TaxID=3365780 RepID=UPI003805C51E